MTAGVGSVAALLACSRVFGKADVPLLRQAYTAYGGPPRFWCSPSYLAADKANRVARLGGCLVVYRAKVLHGHPVLYLLLPPLPLGGGSVPAAVLDDLHHLGVGAKLAAYDMARLAVDAPPEKGNVEWWYTCGPLRTGRAGRRERNALNKLRTMAAYQVHDGLQAPWAGGCEGLARRWQQQVHRHQAELRIVRAYASRLASHQRATVVHDTPTGQVVAYSLTETVASGQAAIVARLRDYAWQGHPDPLLALHANDLGLWPAGYKLTIGAAVGSKGLLAHKQKLPGSPQPLQIHHYAGARKVTLAEWQQAQPVAVVA